MWFSRRVDFLLFEPGLDAVEVGGQEREMVERAGIVRRPPADRILARHQMDDRDRPAIEPIAGEIEIRRKPTSRPRIS